VEQRALALKVAAVAGGATVAAAAAAETLAEGAGAHLQ
jgi:hypothetical protein